MTKKLLLISMLVTWNSISGFPQEKMPFGIGIKPQYGFLIPHRTSMIHLVKSHVPSCEILIDFPGTGKKKWHVYYNQPSWGLTFYTGNLGNKQYIGMGYGLMAYANLHFVKKTRFEWNIRMGTGAGWVQKVFDRTDNNKNVAIGSHLNGMMLLSTEAKFIGKKMDVGTGITMTHYSNGSFTVPNLGLNLPSVFLSAYYKFGNHETQVTPVEKENFERYSSTTAIASFGGKEIYPAGSKRYLVSSLCSYFARHLNEKSALNFGLDYYYSDAIYNRLRIDSTATGSRFSYSQLGVHFGHELKIGNLAMLVQLGTYLIDKYKEDGPVYNRLGVRYYFENHFVASLMLKTHFAKADYFEFGIGYRFNHKKSEK